MHRGYNRRRFSPAVLLTMIEGDRHGARSGAGHDDASLLEELREAIARHDEIPADVADRARAAFDEREAQAAAQDGPDAEPPSQHPV